MSRFQRPQVPLILVLLLILITTWFRLWRLAELPPGFWRDEAYNALDALWMLETHSPQLFLVGNTGREPLLHYLGALSMAILGATPYAFRLVAALVAILTIPLMYRWLVTFFADDPDRRWLGLLAAAGLSFSFWFLVMSRTGYRAVLVPAFVILVLHLFWLGWQRRSALHFMGAGLALGLSQYSYLSARVLPLIFALFALSWLVASGGKEAGQSEGVAGRKVTLSFCGSGSGFSLVHFQSLSEQKALWLGLLIMAIISLAVFSPLAVFFWQHPTTFFSRAADISIVNQAAQVEAPAQTVFLNQLLDALRVFVDGGHDPNWRHTLVGYPGYDWLSRLGFWLGLIVAVRNLRRPRYRLLLISLLVLWLPALLSSVGTLRLSGFLVPYYALMAIGLATALRWVENHLLKQPGLLWPRLTLFGLVLFFSGGLAGYNYFVRWGNESEVYRQFEGPLFDLTAHLIDQSDSRDILIPFPVYTRPTVRFLLHPEFREVETPPAFTPERQAIFVDIPEIADLSSAAANYAYVWLTRAESGQGLSYVFRPHQQADLLALAPTGDAVSFHNARNGRFFANLTPVKNLQPLLPLANRDFAHKVDYVWADQVRLTGYEFTPEISAPGQSPLLNLYWQSVTDQPLPYNIFVQLINSKGDALGQWTDSYLSDQHRWRAGHMTPTQHRLWLDPATGPGAYLVRVGLFDAPTGQRVPIYRADGEPLGDQLLLGPFYIGTDELDPRQPQTPLQAQLGAQADDQIRFLGYSLLPFSSGAATVQTRLYWQVERPIKGDYTTFVQILDEEGRRITGWDSKPLAGQYPTSYWQPDTVIVDTFELPLPATLEPGEYRLVAGMYELETGQRLPAIGADGQPLPDNMIVLRQIALP